MNFYVLEKDTISDLNYKSTGIEVTLLEIQFCWDRFYTATTVKGEEKQSSWINGFWQTRLNMAVSKSNRFFKQ